MAHIFLQSTLLVAIPMSPKPFERRIFMMKFYAVKAPGLIGAILKGIISLFKKNKG